MSTPGARAERIVSRRSDRYASYRDLTVVYEGRSERFAIRTPDLSSRGMFIHLPKYFPCGAVLKVEFVLGRSRRCIKTRAEVRYCLEGVGVGVEFIDIKAEDQEAIEREISSE